MTIEDAPRDPTARAAHYDRLASQARLEAGRASVARIVAIVAEDDQQQIADRVKQTERERERVDQLRETVRAADELVGRLERQDEAAITRRELEAIDEQRTQRIDAALARIRHNQAFKLPITAGEQQVLERFGRAE